MKTTFRLATVAIGGAAALALAANALATQSVAVTQTLSALTVTVAQEATDLQPAKITVYVPAGYDVSATQAPGTTLGKTTGHVIARDAGNIPVQFAGDVTVLDPANPPASAAKCSPGAQIAIWNLHFVVLAQAIDLPVYVSQTSGAETAFGSAKLDLCLPPDDVPMGTPGRAPNGVRLLDATFTVNNTIKPPAAPTRWTSFWTPYAAGTGLPNKAGTVEARSLVGPGAVTITSRVTNRKKKLVRLTGRATQSGVAAVGAKVSLLINSKERFSTKTSPGGTYVFSLKNTRRVVTTTFFQVKVTVNTRDITATGCESPSAPPIPCVSATAGPFTAVSKKIRIRL